MTDEDDFQAALDATPADAALRLVFADWLEGEGDPRAEPTRALARLRIVPLDMERFYASLGVELQAIVTGGEVWKIAGITYLPEFPFVWLKEGYTARRDTDSSALPHLWFDALAVIDRPARNVGLADERFTGGSTVPHLLYATRAAAETSACGVWHRMPRYLQKQYLDPDAGPVAGLTLPGCGEVQGDDDDLHGDDERDQGDDPGDGQPEGDPKG